MQKLIGESMLVSSMHSYKTKLHMPFMKVQQNYRTINLKAVSQIVPDANNWTFLHWAVIKTETNLVRELLQEGFSHDDKDSRDLTPIDLALWTNNVQMIKILRPEINVEEELCNFIQYSSRDVSSRLQEIAKNSPRPVDLSLIFAKALTINMRVGNGGWMVPTDAKRALCNLYDCSKKDDVYPNAITPMARAIKEKDVEKQEQLFNEGWDPYLEICNIRKVYLENDSYTEGFSHVAGFPEFAKRFKLDATIIDINCDIISHIGKRLSDCRNSDHAYNIDPKYFTKNLQEIVASVYSNYRS